MTTIRAALFCLMIVATIACSRKPIELVTFSGTRSIQEGEAAQMFWTFKYADSVVLQPTGTLHAIDGNAVVAPTSTTTYSVIAYRPGIDSLIHPWTISVAPRTGSVVATGPSSAGQSLLPPSDVPSKWLRGSADSGIPSSVRIIGTRRSADGIEVRALLLDAQGNALPADAAAAWTTTCTCRDGEGRTAVTAPPKDALWTAADQTAATVICFDNSAVAGSLARNGVEALAKMLPALSAKDSVGVVLYDHELLEIAPLGPPANVATSLLPSSVPPARGLTAMFTAVQSSISMLAEHSAPERSIIVVAASDDNASLASDFTSVQTLARNEGIRIHTIRVGTTAMGYMYRSLATATGGRAYLLADGSAVADVVREVLLGSRRHTGYVVPIPESEAPCQDVTVTVVAGRGTQAIRDSVRVPIRDRSYRQPYMAVAMFQDSTDEGLKTYHPSLALLAEDLMERSDKTIELIGHVGRDVTNDPVRRAYDRARGVADLLIGWGVPARRIQVRSEGSNKPLYYMQLDEWQRRMNNRVEMRWLDADDEPYTIMVEQVASEDMAEKAVAQWEARGYKAYFEPIATQKGPAYRVKLWGFVSYEQAVNTSRDVARRYKVTTAVE